MPIIFLRYKVTVVAKEFTSPVASGKCITSEIAGALWEWPPAVCGRHTDERVSMGWWHLRLSAKILVLLRLSVNFFHLRLTMKLKINFFVSKR